MPLTKQERELLESKANELRHLCIDTVVWGHSGHVGGAMSAMDIMTILYHKYMNIDPQKPDWEDRDRFVLSKGHVGVGYAPVLADKGYFEKEWLKDFNLTGSRLGMHLDAAKVPGVDASTGSLGHGLAMGLGMALAARVQGRDYRVYCLLGDGECDEGEVWEAAMAASHFNATNLITFVDRNLCMIDGKTEDVMKLEPFADKWRAFGFDVKEINGHDFGELAEAMDYALAAKDAPVLILANTVKGCGVDYMEGDYRWHYGALNEERTAAAKESLDRYYENRVKGV